MNTTTLPSNQTGSKRIDMVDAIRGFALAGIVLVHNLEHFLFFAGADKNPAWLSTIDPKIWESVFFLFSGKAYGIFSLLFGFSFWIQYENQRTRGYEFAPRFAWRMVLLLGWGALHGLFYAGDILSIYALASFVIILTRNWPDRWVILLTGLLLLQPVDLAHTVYSYLHPEYKLISDVWPLMDHLKEAQLNGPFLKMLFLNATYGHLSNLAWNWEFGRFFQAPALFLIGMLAARRRVFVDVRPKFWFTVLGISLAAAIPLHFLCSWLDTHIDRQQLRDLANTLAGLYSNVPRITLMLAILVLLWHYSRHLRRVIAIFAPFGRMSLTNYITQSVIGSTLYMGYGFGLYLYCGGTLSFGIGVMILMVQLFWSHWWLKRFTQGPLEFLWKKGTWLGHERYHSIRLLKQARQPLEPIAVTDLQH